MRFTKMHGLGNDFIVVEDFQHSFAEPSEKARELCRRHFSVGADGLVLLQQPAQQSADYRMRIYNSDGSEAEMCGNALRCVALYARRYLKGGDKLVFETGGGLKETVITADAAAEGDAVNRVRVNMGKPELNSDLIPVTGPRREIVGEEIRAAGQSFTYTAVSMGNPHCVIFVDNKEQQGEFSFDDVSLNYYGPALERHEAFPNYTNVEFARIIAPGKVEVKVWERGAGATLACGTGACAVVVAGVKQNKFSAMPVEVILPGGSLLITWEPGHDVIMEGPAGEVFRGEM